MQRCKHGFVTCYECRHNGTEGLGCHYPGCEDRPDRRDKYCPKHGGRFSAHHVEGLKSCG